MISAVYALLSKMTELNDDFTKMADILNETLLCIMLLLILGHFEN